MYAVGTPCVDGTLGAVRDNSYYRIRLRCRKSDEFLLRHKLRDARICSKATGEPSEARQKVSFTPASARRSLSLPRRPAAR